MARPTMRNIQGRWSLVQVAAEAGVSHRTARTVAEAGFIDPRNLRYKDIALVRVGAALLDAPRPHGLDRGHFEEARTARNFEALRLARTVIDQPRPDPGAILAVFPTAARLADNPMKAMGILGDMGDQPVLILPIGAWAAALIDLALTEQRVDAS